MGRDHRRSDDIQRRIAIAQGPRKRRPHTRPRRGVALAEEYAPEHTTPKAAGRGHLRHQTVNRLMDDSGNDEIAAHSLTNNAPDAATTSQTEEFNLRQAIIYSEILKPKFEE